MDDNEFHKLILRIKYERKEKIHTPKAVIAGDADLILGMDDKQLKSLIDYMNGLPFDDKVAGLTSIVDNTLWANLDHKNLKQIFNTFSQEFAKVQ
jgi:hypothetical protein